MANPFDDLFEDDLDLAGLFDVAANDPFHNNADAAQSFNDFDREFAVQDFSTTQTDSPTKRQHDDASQDGAISPSEISPTKRQRTDNNAMIAPPPALTFPQAVCPTLPPYHNFVPSGDMPPAPTSFFPAPPIMPAYAGVNSPATAPVPDSLRPILPRKPVFGPVNDDDETTTPSSSNGAAGTPERYNRPGKNRKRWTVAQLKDFVELGAIEWKHFQKDVGAFLQDPRYPERLQAHATNQTTEAREAAEERMSEILDLFLNHNTIGLKYFGRGVDSNEGKPRSWYWPEDSKAAKAAVECLFVTKIKGYKHRARERKAHPSPPPTKPSTPVTVFHTAVHCMGMKNGVYQQAMPRMNRAVTKVDSYDGVRAQVAKALKEKHMVQLWDGAPAADVSKAEMWLHGPAGLVQIENAEQWAAALAEVEATWWMDNELKLVFFFEKE